VQAHLQSADDQEYDYSDNYDSEDSDVDEMNVDQTLPVSGTNPSVNQIAKPLPPGAVPVAVVPAAGVPGGAPAFAPMAAYAPTPAGAPAFPFNFLPPLNKDPALAHSTRPVIEKTWAIQDEAEMTQRVTGLESSMASMAEGIAKKQISKHFKTLDDP